VVSVMLLSALVLAPARAAPADTGSDCTDWGTVYPGTRDTYVGEFVTFRIGGGRACGDVDSCSWWTDGSQGDFLQTTGSPVTWRAPSSLDQCVTASFRLWASCTDGNTTGYSDITVRCTHEQLDEVKANRDAVVSGGGCGGPSAPTSTGTSGAALFLLPWLGLRRRKARRADDSDKRSRSPRGGGCGCQFRVSGDAVCVFVRAIRAVCEVLPPRTVPCASRPARVAGNNSRGEPSPVPVWLVCG